MTFRDSIVYVSMTKDGYFALEMLLKAGKQIDHVITLSPDLAASVSDYADFTSLCTNYGVACWPVASIKEVEQQLVVDKPKIIFVNGWSEMLSKALVTAPVQGCVGTHPALLPKNRGRAPIAWHFLNEETRGGVTLFYLDEGCDSGPIIDQREFTITYKDNATSYYERITHLGADLLLQHFNDLISAKILATTQDHSRATYLLKRIPEDSWLDFHWTSGVICNHIRAVAAVYPLGYFYYEGAKILVSLSGVPSDVPHYSGVSGQVAAVSDVYVRIITADGVVDLLSIYSESGEKLIPREVFKVGRRVNQLKHHYV